jgi:hypothetical protein
MKGSKSTKPARRRRVAAVATDTPAYSLRSAEVVLDVEVEQQRVHLVLANCGDAVATDVQVTFSRGLTALGGSLEISGLPVFKHLGVLRPGRSVRIFWDAAPSLFAERGQTAPFIATVSWNERLRARQQADYRHDLSIYRQLPESLGLE